MTRALRPRDPNTPTFAQATERRPTLAAAAGLGLGAVALAVMIVFAFHDGPGPLPNVDDKLQHLVAFVGLGFLFAVGRSANGVAIAGALLFGGAFVLEALQPLLTQTREASLKDALASCAGAGLGLLAAASLNVVGSALSRGQRVKAT